MSALRESLGDYLALRRSVGYKLEGAARMLASFVAFAERAGAGTITTELALSWAAQPQQASPIWLAHRLSAVRGFARYLHALDPAARSRPLTCSRRRAISRRLLTCTPTPTSPPAGGSAAADPAVVGGDVRDTAWPAGGDRPADRGGDAARPRRRRLGRGSARGAQLEVRAVPGGGCHDSTVEALAPTAPGEISSAPGRPRRAFSSPALGRRLAHHSVYATFHKLAGEAGLRQRPGGRPPRVHGLRHSFAVRTLLRWYRDGGDVQARLPLLSTYLGHVRPPARTGT